MRCTLLVFAVLLLAGCATPQHQDRPTDAIGMPPPATTPPNETVVFTGLLVGVGTYSADGSGQFLGISDLGNSLDVQAPVRGLDIELVWNVTAPALVALQVFDGHHTNYTQGTPADLVARSIRVHLDSPTPGPWVIDPAVEGPTVMQYTLTVKVRHS